MARPATTKFDNPFSRFRPETVQEERKPLGVTESETFKRLRIAWRDYSYSKDDGNELSLSSWNYRRAKEAIDHALGLEMPAPTAEDVARFCIILKEFEKEDTFAIKAGLFLSALIEMSNGEQFAINVSHLDAKLIYFGYQNIKKVHVIGNLGRHTADSHGEQVLDGPTVKLFPDAEFIVDGNVGISAARFMRAGRVVINGTVDRNLGQHRMGGEIHVNGDYATIGQSVNKINMYYKRHQREKADEVKK